MTPADEQAGREAGGRAVREARWFAVVVLALGVFAALVLVGRPGGLGLSVLCAGLFAAAAVAARRRDPWTVAWWLLAAALAAMAAVRSAGWVWGICLLDAALLASLAATGGRSARQVLAGLLGWLAALPLGPLATLAPLARSPLGAGPRRIGPAVRGGALAALLLAVFVPLFASADAAFAEIVGRAVPSDLPFDRPAGRVLALLAVVAAGGALALVARHGPVRPARAPRLGLARLEWLLPLGSLVVLFAAFVALQLATLFGGHGHVLQTAGLTYAEYAREGFGQLMAAAALTLAVLGGARRWARTGGGREEWLLRALLAALCLLCLVVLASALKRLGLYEQAFGFTRLRLVADAQILWLGAVLVLVLAAVPAGRTAWLPRAVVAVSAAGALAFALSDPDGRIAQHNVDRFERSGRIDLPYLAGLGPDAAPALARLPADRAACATAAIRRTLAAPDGLAGANLGRSRARRALAGVPRPGADCSAR